VFLNTTEFAPIKQHALSFRHSSFQYIDFDNLDDCQIIADNDTLVLLWGYSTASQSWQYHWAADSAADLIPHLTADKPFILTFVPKEWVPALESADMQIRSVWHDYFRKSLDDIATEPEMALNLLSIDEAEEAAKVTQQCAGLSRGFSGQSADWFREWLSSNEMVNDPAILGHRDDNGELVGVLCTGLYGQENQQGGVVWIKEVAVTPGHQGQGIGRQLITQALYYGKRHSARKAFLAVDEDNVGAIHLYESLGFVASEEEGEINMMKESSID
jgi:ribosomal protein S18 acetylase RimI-like enzyme